MPLYAYKNTKTGGIEEMMRPVSERDSVPAHLKRITAPQRVCVVAGGRTDPRSADGSVPKAFRDLEASGMSARAIAKQTGFTVDQIKRVWNLN